MARPRPDPGSGVTVAGWRVWSVVRWGRGRARHPGVCGARLQHQLVTALPEPSNLRPHGSGQCLVEDTGRAGPGCFLWWAGRWWRSQCPQPFWSGSLGPAVVSLRVPCMCTHMCQTAAPSLCQCAGSPYPDLSPNSSLHSTHFLHKLQTSSSRVLAKTFIDGFLVNYQISSLA